MQEEQANPLEPRPRLHAKLQRSHRAIALLGLGALAMACAGVRYLSHTASRIADVRTPTVQACARATTGLNQSLSSLHTWLLLKDPIYLKEREEVWRVQIEPAIATLMQLATRWNDPKGLRQLELIEEQLNDLREVQWWITEAGSSEGSEPARLALVREIEPALARLIRATSSMIDMEQHLEANDGRKMLLVHLANMRQSLLQYHNKLSEFVGVGTPESLMELENARDDLHSHLSVLGSHASIFTVQQSQLHWFLQQEIDQLLAHAGIVTQRRSAADWNGAMDMLTVRCRPLATGIVTQLEALTREHAAVMRADVMRLNYMAQAILYACILEIGIMFLVANRLARRQSDQLTKPIAELVSATHDLAFGRPGMRLPIANDDELGELTRSFNEMKEVLEAAKIRQAQFRQTLEQKNRQLTAARDEASQAAEELTKSNKELDDFAYIASHDLKEPLRGIHNYANFLLEDYGDKLDEQGKHKLETLSRLCGRLEGFIESLLQYSRLGQTELGRQEVDLSEVIDGVVDSLQFSLDENGVAIEQNGRMPVTRCDRVRIGEVFHNLIVNAIKYNDKPDKRIELGVLTNDTGKTPDVYYVRDNGIGIPEKHHDSVFRIFKRLHGRNKYGGGNGAGLTIVRKIVEQHGGTIWLETEPGVGTTFFFTLEKGQHHDPANFQRCTTNSHS